MPELMLFFLLFFSCTTFASIEVKEATLLLEKGSVREAIALLEERFNKTEDEKEQGEIAYLLSLNPEHKTQKSMSYYIQNALEKYSNLDPQNKARLTRLLADTSFETGNLEKALQFYNESLIQKENSNLYDYLSLQKTWVLVNLKKSEEAMNFLFNFITNNKSQIIDSMVYDFGRLYIEYLDQTKNNVKEFDLNIIPSSKELISGFFAGIARTSIAPKELTPILKKHGLYEEFYTFGLETKRIGSYNNCSLLSWETPNPLSQKLVRDISLELIKCQEKKDRRYGLLYENLLKSNIKSNELALLSTSLNDNKTACSQYEFLLESEYNEQWYSFYLANCLTSKVNSSILNYTRKISNKNYIRTILNNEAYNKALTTNPKIQTDDHIHFIESLFTTLKVQNNEIDKVLLTQSEAIFNSESAIYCLFYTQNCKREDVEFTFRYLSNAQKVIYVLDFIKDKNFEAANNLLISAPNLLENNLIAKEIYLNAKNFKGLYNDSLFKFLSEESLLKEIYISAKEQAKLKKKLTNFWADSIDIISTLTRVAHKTRALSTIERQDQFFRQISRLQKKLAIQKWPNTETREIVISNYKSVLRDTVIGLQKNPTDISGLIESKLESWEKSI